MSETARHEQKLADGALARSVAGPTRVVARVVGLAFAAYQLWVAAPFSSPIPDLIHRSIHLAFAFTLCFLLFPARPGASPSSRASLVDWALIAASLVGFAYLVVHYHWIMENPATSTPVALLLGTLVFVAALEAARRTMGPVFVGLAVLSVAYALFGSAIPGFWGHIGFDWREVIETLYLSTFGIVGSVTGVSASVVAVFLIFGSLLAATGGSDTFIDLAKIIARRSPGGPAKVSIYSSALFGTISGSAVANVVADGIFSIPLMKRMGYRGEFAAAVEATASSGGQIVPPIMGAGAFIMAELLGRPYFDIAVAAAIPAALYYLGCTAGVHFAALRLDLARLDPSMIPRLASVLAWRRAAPFFVPIAVLIVFLVRGFTPTTATFWAIAVMVAIYALGATSRADLVRRGRVLLEAFESGARSVVLVAALVAAAQVIIAMINLTGIGVKLSETIIAASGQYVLVSLALAMVVCLILGMGLPTTAAYVLAASVVAPALIGLGIDRLAAHLFVFYFAIVSAITPPVCAAVYVAAAIARASWWRTSIMAMKLGAAAFVVPYMFVYSTTLLWQGTGREILLAATTAGIGVVALAGGTIGYWLRWAGYPVRVLLVAGALGLIKPGLYTDGIGFGLLAIATAIQAYGRVAVREPA